MPSAGDSTRNMSRMLMVLLAGSSAPQGKAPVCKNHGRTTWAVNRRPWHANL